MSSDTSIGTATMDISQESVINVLDGEEPLRLSTLQELSSYIGQYPEAENDQACRLFTYTSRCPKPLLVALFSNFDFALFSMFPFGLTSQQPVARTWASNGICPCERCRAEETCGRQAMEISINYIIPISDIVPQKSNLPITSTPSLCTLRVQNKTLSFRTVTWGLQVFRFRSRRLEHIEHAFDALLYCSCDTQTTLHAEPVGYVVQQLREILIAWNSAISCGTEYLGYFRFEILEERLEYDRKIIRNLLMAARMWETFRRLFQEQSKQLQFLQDLKSFPTWVGGCPDLEEIQSIANTLIAEFATVGPRIDTELVDDTNVLIQQITNLISIDQGYRSRDQNSSMRRLSWITFVFLPLVFAASIFGMNVDLFQNDPSWVYYVYLSIPLFVVILSLYVLLKNKRRITRALSYVLHQLLGRMSSGGATDEERAMAVDDENSEEILRWAASAGRADIIRTIGQPLNALSTKPSQRGTPLLLAIKNGHQDIAEFLIPKTKSLDAVDEGGATALHWAAKHGMTRISEQLISKGANMHIKDKNGMGPQAWAIKGKNRELRLGQRATAISGWQNFIEPEQQPLGDIFPAVETGDLAEINLLNGNGESLELRDSAGRTALFRAITSKQLDALGLLINLGANINAIDNQGFTPLHVAVQEGYSEAAQLLITRGADVSARSNSRLTPLLLADTVEHLPILRILVERGADINAIDDASTTIVHMVAKKPKPYSAILYHFLALHHAELDKKDNAMDTPAHLAACFGNTEFIRFLKEKEKDIEHCRNRAGVTPLMVAVEKDQVVVVKLLMEMGISPNVRGQGSSLPLSMTLWECAVWWGKAESLSILEQYGATCTAIPNPDDPDRLGKSALHPIWHAVEEQHTAVVLQLIDTRRCDVSMVKFGNVSLLYCAADTSNAKLVKGLLERGADPNAVDWYGWTPLHSAAFSGNAQITAAFIQQANDISKLDEQGWTALDLATFYRHWNVVDLLDPGRMVKVFPWQIPKETRCRIINGQRKRYSWTPDVQESAQGRVEVP